MIQHSLDHPRIVDLVHPSTILRRRRKRCLVVAPPEEAPPGPLPVCYFFHGRGGNALSFLNHPEIRRRVLAAHHFSLFPESFRRWFINDHEGHRYEDYFVEELRPLVEEHLAGRAEPGRRGVVGFSMGAAAALLLAVRHPGLFRAVACHSGAFEAPRRTGDPYAHLRHEQPILMPTEADHEAVWGPPGSATRQRYDPYRFVTPELGGRLSIYLDVGVDDFPRMVGMNRRFHHALEVAGVPHVYAERPGGHDMEFVAGALPHSLAFITAALNGENRTTPDAQEERMLTT